MAIEPLNSAMTLQVQNVPKVKEAAKTNVGTAADSTKTAEVYTENTVVTVAKGEEKSSADNQNNNNKENQQANNEKIRKAVEQLNKNMSHSEAVFGIHDKTNRLTIKIVDRDTKEIIKEFPPEKTLDMIAKVWELAGILVDEKR